MMQVEQKTKGGPIEVTTYGKYEDTLVKTPKGWRFKERNSRADTFHGHTTPVLPAAFAPVDQPDVRRHMTCRDSRGGTR